VAGVRGKFMEEWKLFIRLTRLLHENPTTLTETTIDIRRPLI